MPSALVAPFAAALENHTERLRALHAGGQKIIGHFCTYTPVEIIHAAGFVPVRILGGSGPLAKAYTLAPTFVCPPLLRSLERAREGHYDYLSGIVQAYTCDAACGMVNIWEENVIGPDGLSCSLPLPYSDDPDARAYFRACLEELIEKLEHFGGAVTPASLSAACTLYEEIRRLIMSFFASRHEGKLALGARELHTVIQAGFVTPPDAYLALIRELAGRLSAGQGALAPSKGVPILLSGSLIEDPRIFEIIAEAGGQIVADDLCTGLRSAHTPAGEGADPLARIIDRTLKRLPCPTRARARQRLPFLLSIIRQTGARGVVFAFQKFCTPHQGDFPILRDELRSEGIPALMIEMEATGLAEGQLRTRLQSFMEIAAP